MTYRYAIYVAPAVAAAHTWLAAPEAQAVTRSVRRYGFHGTIKAPFRLAPGHTLTELRDRLAAFAAARGPVVVPTLRLACLNGFFALVAGHREPALHALADDVVRDFDDLRAPATDAEIARRRPERLDDRELALLLAYGYPYVLDRFVFHLTLTDPIPADGRAAMESVLRRRFADALGHDLALDALALFVEPDPGRPFQFVESYPLKGTS